MTYLGIFLACGCGALLRYALAEIFKNKPSSLHLATLLANLLACFILGYLSTSHLSDKLFTILATGFCGGLSTFSTLQAELIERASNYVSLFTYWLLSYGLGWLLLNLGQSLASS